MRFPVKKNPLLVILAIALVPLGLIDVVTKGDTESFAGLIVLVIISIPLIWALFQSYHEITEHDFKMVFGPIRKTIPLRDIRTVKYTFNPLSSPAWTLKRLEVVSSNYKSILMSRPQNEPELKQMLQDRCPHAKIDM